MKGKKLLALFLAVVMTCSPVSSVSAVENVNEAAAGAEVQPTQAPVETTEVQPTETPTTETPTTEVQSTETPTTEAQPTETPTTEAQPTETPTTEAQPTETPTTEAQPTETPTTEVQPVETTTTVETEVIPEFKIDRAVVTLTEENLKAELFTSNTHYNKIYIGRKEDAEKTPVYEGTVLAEGGYKYEITLPEEMQEQQIYVVPYNPVKEEWFIEKDITFVLPPVTEDAGEETSDEEGQQQEETDEEAGDEEEAVEEEQAEDVAGADESSETDNDPAYEDGEYDIAIESTFAMFSITSQSAVVSNGEITVTIETSSKTYDRIYLGSKNDEANYPNYIQGVKKEGEDGYVFTFTLDKTLMGQSIDFVPGKSDGTWYAKKQYQLTIPAELTKKEAEDEPETPDNTTKGEIADGDYTVDVGSNNAMFKIVNAVLTNKGGTMTAQITLSGTGYDKLFMGSAADAANAAEDQLIGYTTDAEGKYVFEIPVSALDTPIAVAVHGVKKDTWYDRELTFASDTLKEYEKPLENGDYNVSVETGAAMFKVVKAVLTNNNGIMTAQITLSGTGYDKLFMGSAADAANAAEDQLIGYTTDAEGKYVFEIPVSALDTPIAAAAHAVKSGSWIDRSLTFSSDSLEFIDGSGADTSTPTPTPTPVPDTSDDVESDYVADTSGKTSAVNNSTTISDGTYKTDSFEWSGGSGKTQIVCDKVTVKDGKAYATIHFTSGAFPYILANGNKYTGTCDASTSCYTIPVTLGKENIIYGYSSKMDAEIQYKFTPTLSENSEEIEDTTPTTTPTPTPTPTPSSGNNKPSGNQGNGIYSIDVESSAIMFKVVNCVLTSKDGKYTADITLSGTGYDYLYVGTADAAAKANKSQYIGYKVNSAGQYVYTIPVSALDTPISIAAHAIKSGDWYDRELTFKSSSMKLLTELGGTVPQVTPTPTPVPDNKPEGESKYEADLSGGTSAVDNSTGLADGVYTPDKFSWSGGSGRTSITCTKVTVTNGQAYATIVFSSSNYGYVKANGNKYFPSYGAGTSSFTIPVKLNANNTIIGMTTAMSAAHEITYSIYIYIAGADKKAAAESSNDKLSETAPDIIGLEYTDEAKIEHAEYFKIYYYDQDITLIEVDMTTDTDKPEEEETEEAETAEETEESAVEELSEEESGETEEIKDTDTIISELYQNNVVKYLLVPEGVEIPVGLEKEMIVVNLPVESVYSDSEQAEETLEELELEDLLTVKNEKATEKPEYKELILKQCDLAILSDDFLWDKEKEDLTLEEQTELLYEVTERLTTLGIPAIVDRSEDEKSEEAAAEWTMVYEELFDGKIQ